MASTPRLAAGTSFAGDFRVLGPLAEGGMGSVYRAEQLSTRKLRALKIVHGRLLDDERSRARFLREATIGASIASEHVVEVISAGIDAATELPYLVMELLEGADLGTLVKHRGRLSAAELGAVLRQLCHGLGAAHDAKVVHRDLKPENVYVAYPRHAGTAFTVKVLDFGIARIAQESKSVATLTGTVGSPLWMAPEQINNEPIVPATDIWALGLLAFWMLTGQPYWRTARADRLTVQALFAEQLFRALEPASLRAQEMDLGEAIPPGFDDWFALCVARVPGERFTDAHAAWSAFAQAVDEGVDGRVSLLPPPHEAWPPSGSAPLSIVESTQPDDAARERGSDVHGAPATSSLGMDSPTIVGTTQVGASLDDVKPPSPRATPPIATHRRAWWAAALVPAIAVPLATGLWWVTRRDVPTTTDEPAKEIRTAEDPVVRDDGGPVPPIPDPPLPAEGAGDADDGGPPEVHEHGPIAPIRPMATQPSFSMRALTVLGWTEDGSRFALDATYPDRDGVEGPVTKLRLVEVHDALTGAMIASYLAERESVPNPPSHDRLVRAGLEAEPMSEWEFTRNELRLVAMPAQHDAPTDGVAIHAEIDPVPVGTTMAVEATPEGVKYRWSFGATRVLPDDTVTPRIRLRWSGPKGSWELLDVPLAIRPTELASAALPEGDGPIYAGEVKTIWSPDGDRLLVVITGRAERVVDASRLFDVRWFLRANGPQIRVVDAGLGQRRLRVVADRLARAGLPVAAAELDSEPVAESRIYVRARDSSAAALATAINAALGTSYESALLERAGWTQVVVVLGADAP